MIFYVDNVDVFIFSKVHMKYGVMIIFWFINWYVVKYMIFFLLPVAMR